MLDRGLRARLAVDQRRRDGDVRRSAAGRRSRRAARSACRRARWRPSAEPPRRTRGRRCAAGTRRRRGPDGPRRLPPRATARCPPRCTPPTVRAARASAQIHPRRERAARLRGDISRSSRSALCAPIIWARAAARPTTSAAMKGCHTGTSTMTLPISVASASPNIRATAIRSTRFGRSESCSGAAPTPAISAPIAPIRRGVWRPTTHPAASTTSDSRASAVNTRRLSAERRLASASASASGSSVGWWAKGRARGRALRRGTTRVNHPRPTAPSV